MALCVPGILLVSVNTNALDRLLWHLMKCLLTHAFRNTSFQLDCVMAAYDEP